MELAREGGFDLIILDVMMPKIDGLQACMRIREFSNVPIIMLTAKGEDTDKIIGFECGADDYLTKPFNILELKARVRALLRRAGAAQQQRSGNELAAGHIILNTGERTASRDGVSVELTAKEFDLMELLMMGRKPEAEVEKAVMEFVTRYGLLGLMTALPTTPSFMDYEAVYLPKNHFIKEESMATDKYLSLFYPFDQLDLVKKGYFS